MIDRSSIRSAWLRRRASERAAIATIAAIAVAAIIVFAVLLPLTGAVERARSDLARTQALLAATRAQHAIEASLARSTAVGGTEPAAAVARVLAQHALVPLARPQSAADGSVDVIIAAAPFDTLVRALDTLAVSENLRVARMLVTALANEGNVRAEFRLRRGVTP